MAYTNQTKHGLPLYVASDKPAYLTDWNEAMTTIDALIDQTDAGAIDDLQKQVQQNTIDISSIKNKNTQQDTQIANNAGDIQQLGTRVTALEQGGGGGNIPPDIQQQIDDNTKNTASNTAAISSLQTELQNVKNVNDTQATQIANLQTKDTQQDSVINNNTASISNLQNRVSVLEQQGGGGSYTLPVATNNTLGGVKIGSGINRTADGTISVPAAPGYTLPTATATRLGGVKVGSGLSVAADGTLSVSGGASGGLTVSDIAEDWTSRDGSDGRLTIYYNKTTLSAMLVFNDSSLPPNFDAVELPKLDSHGQYQDYKYQAQDGGGVVYAMALTSGVANRTYRTYACSVQGGYMTCQPISDWTNGQPGSSTTYSIKASIPIYIQEV